MNTTPVQFKHPCFYVPGSHTIIDTAELRDDVWRSTIHNEDLDQIRIRHPNAELADFDVVYQRAEDSHRTEPVEITEDEYTYALEVLPPVNWKHARGIESFKMSERLYGQVTSIYARIGGRHFTFNDLITLTAEQIADRIAQSAAFKRAPLRFMTLDQFRALNSGFYQPGTADQHSTRDHDLLNRRVRKLNQREGPRVGDFVLLPDGAALRFTYEWPDGPRAIQTTTRGTNANPSFYISKSGFCDYSGSLDSALPVEQLEETTETRFGRVWFFANEQARASNGVYADVCFRVYRYRPDENQPS